MLEALATPESVIARPTWNPEANVFGREKELLLDPKTLFNYVLQELDPNVMPKSVYPVLNPTNPAPGWLVKLQEAAKLAGLANFRTRPL